jgi:thioredoxin-related protein
MKSMLIPLKIGSWRQWAASFVFGLCFLSLCMAARAEEARDAKRTIAWAESFVADAGLSREGELPIVIFVTQQGCQFCAALRRQVLYPMIRAGELTDSAIIREVSLDTGFVLQDFSGNEIAGKIFANRYGAIVTPTLLFLDDDGTEVAEKKVGISNIEFYGFYLLKSLESARKQLKKCRDRLKPIHSACVSS